MSRSPRPVPNWAQRALRPSLAAVIGTGIALLAGCIGLRSVSDNSFFTHLATGRIMLQSGIPHEDVYSFSAAGEPWVVQSWLTSWMYGWADSWAGGVGIRLLTAAVIAGIVGLTWRLTQPAQTLLPRLAITGLMIGVGAVFWVPRPLVFGLLFFTALVVLFEERRDPRWAVPIMWVWVNSHGSFPLGLLAIACLTAGAKLDGKDARPGMWLLAWSLLGTLVGAVGPIGPQILIFPLGVLGKMEILSRVVEWQSPNFSSAWGRLFLVQVILAVVALVRRPRFRAAVPLLVFVPAALIGLRNFPLASIILVPGLARGFAGLGTLRGRERGPLVTVAGMALVAATMVTGSVLLAQPSYDLSTYPVDALAWLDQNPPSSANLRLATKDTTGGYIELLRGRSAQVFLDDRYDMYPLPLLRDYLVLNAGSLGWQQVLADRRIDCVLWERSDPLAQLLTEDQAWSTRYQDLQVMVSCRRGLP